ncbi:TPA: hypothetical protein DDW35_00150 [Candidatus Sumerlaeota bacterium]|nr:hypothetical protein [Candidatus Sumerlaeota bacterium]
MIHRMQGQNFVFDIAKQPSDKQAKGPRNPFHQNGGVFPKFKIQVQAFDRIFVCVHLTHFRASAQSLGGLKRCVRLAQHLARFEAQ